MATIPDRDLQEIVDSSTFVDPSATHNREQIAREQTIARLRLLWSRRKLLFRASVCGLVIGTLIAFLIPKRFESTTRLMPPDDQSGSGMAMAAVLAGKLSGGLGGLAGNILGLKSSGDLFIGILRSWTVEDHLINKFQLQKVYGHTSMAATRQKLAENTSIAEDRKSGIITVTVTDHDPKQAAQMAQEYVTELNAVVSQLSTSSARREREFLQGRLAQVEQDLEKAEKDFSEFSSKNGAIDIKEQGRAMVGAAATLQGQLIAVESELEGLKQIYADNNVRVRSLQARATEIRKQMEELGGKDRIHADAGNPKDKSMYPTIRELPLLGVTWTDLYRRSQVEEAIYETLTQEYELAKVAEAKEIPSVKVLDPADVPERKSFPPRLAIMLLFSFLCFAIALSWVLGEARWLEIDSRDVRKRFVQEVVQTVNSSMPWSSPNGSGFHSLTHSVWMKLVRSKQPRR